MVESDAHKIKTSILVRIGDMEKNLLKEQAKGLGMNLTTYSRMILIQAIKK